MTLNTLLHVGRSLRVRMCGWGPLVVASRCSSTIQQEINKFNRQLPLEKARTPPASWYIHPGFHDLDSTAVFNQSWLAVGLTHQLQKPGDYITGSVADEPYIVICGPDHKLRAFYNVCRHHATILIDSDSGCTDKLECPYHGWTYSLDGRLTRATRLRGIEDFSARNFGLKSIETTTWGPLVFIHMGKDENKDDVGQWLQPLYEQVEPMGFTSGFRFVKRKRYEIGCNWKVFIDNYLDGGYHIPYAHKALAELLQPRSYTVTAYKGFSVQSGQAVAPAENSKNTAETADCVEHDSAKNRRVGGEVLYAHIFPNLMLNRYGPWLDVNYCWPTGPEKCVVVFDWLLNEEDGREDHQLENELEASERVQYEDVQLCERVQRGLRSRSYEWGRYAPRVEHADYDFHVALSQRYNNVKLNEQ